MSDTLGDRLGIGMFSEVDKLFHTQKRKENVNKNSIQLFSTVKVNFDEIQSENQNCCRFFKELN
jgi:hypothetical protein